ncbi:MAG: mechanosensitive ion channel family protein [Bryobacterales bacterium]|nr:mechanosensitive ion channel family protein [Bryobacterales bacterium]
MVRALDFLADIPSWSMIIGLMVFGVVVGWLCEKLFARWAGWAQPRLFSGWGDTVLGSVHRMPIIWCGAAGTYLGVRVAGYVDPWRDLVGTAVSVIFIVTLVVVAMRLSTAFIGGFAKRAVGVQASTTLVQNVVRLLLLIVGIALVLQNVGIDITTIVTALGISGLAVALALQDTLGNLFAGMQIIMSRQIRPGDYVTLSTGEEGSVTDIQARNTTISTFPERNRVLVPNSILASTVLTNFSLPRRRLFIRLPVGVSYDSNLEQVEAVTLDVARSVLRDVEGGLTDEDPFVRFEEFSDFSINFLLRVPVSQFTDQFLVRHELVKRLHERYGAEGIEIPFPIRTVFMRKRSAGRKGRVGPLEGGEGADVEVSLPQPPS